VVVWGVGARKSQEENLPNNVLVTVLNSVVTGRRFSSFVPSSTMRKLFTCIRAGVLALDTACSQGGFQGWQVQLNATLVHPNLRPGGWWKIDMACSLPAQAECTQCRMSDSH